LYEHFYWSKVKKDVQKICNGCITYRQAKSKVLSYSLYTSLLVLKEP